jgi:hypothetical protein
MVGAGCKSTVHFSTLFSTIRTSMRKTRPCSRAEDECQPVRWACSPFAQNGRSRKPQSVIAKSTPHPRSSFHLRNNAGQTVTPSSHRRYHPLGCRLHAVHLHPRQALLERRHRSVPTDQKVLSRSFLNACPMVRCMLRQPQRRWVGKLPEAGGGDSRRPAVQSRGRNQNQRRTANGAKSY